MPGPGTEVSHAVTTLAAVVVAGITSASSGVSKGVRKDA